MKRKAVLAAAVVIAITTGTVEAQVAITKCATRVVDSSAFLAADLDCSGLPIPSLAVRMTGKGSSLDMRGHTITAGTVGIFCDDKCHIFGGGTVSGAESIGIRGPRRGRLTLEDITVTDCLWGVSSNKSRAFLRNSVVINNRKLGISGPRLRLDNSLVSGNGFGVETLTDGGMGVSTWKRARFRNSSVIDNFGGGIIQLSSRLRLKGSVVSGNARLSDCGTQRTCADLIAGGRRVPFRMRDSSCGTSYVLDSGIPGESWGVCSLD